MAVAVPPDMLSHAARAFMRTRDAIYALEHAAKSASTKTARPEDLLAMLDAADAEAHTVRHLLTPLARAEDAAAAAAALPDPVPFITHRVHAHATAARVHLDAAKRHAREQGIHHRSGWYRFLTDAHEAVTSIVGQANLMSSAWEAAKKADGEDSPQ